MIRLRVHHDADGLISGYLASYGVKDSQLEIWDGKFGDTTGLKPGDYMLDMRPIQNMEGLTVIDHHLPHREDRKYTLISDDVPASLISWRLFKDKIPKGEWWKTTIGIVGDGQPELIPTEIFETTPELLSKVKTSSYQTYGKWRINYYPTYKLVSSYVNALLRKGEFQEAINLVKYAQKPFNIIHSNKAKQAKADIQNEFQRIIKEADSYELDNLAIVIFTSEFRLTGYVASVIQEVLGKTTIAINRKDGSGSLRGDLATYWRDKLRHLDYLEVDGHPGFMGLTITINPDTLVEDIVNEFG